MNVNPYTTVIKSAALAIALLMTATGATGMDFPDVLEDPLSTRPPVLAIGATLPGDSESIPCPADKDFSLPLALGEAVDLALCNNPRIKAAWAAIKVEAGVVGEAKAAYLPTLNGTVSRLHNHTEYPNSRLPSTNQDGTTVYGNLAWRLFDFGGRAANREAAGKLLDAALASHDATLQKTLVTVVQDYFDAITAQAALIAKTEAAQIAQATLEASRKREAKGAAPQGDTLQAAAALARANLAKQRALGDQQKAKALLVQAMGVSTHTKLILPDTIAALPAEAAKELDQWLTEAENTHPAIKSARAQWLAAQRKVDVARSEGLPSLDFTASYYQNGYPNQGLQATQTNITTVGVTLNIPFFEGFARTYKIRGAQAQVEQREAELQDTEHQILTEVVKAHADAVASLNNLQSSESLLDAAQSALSSSQRRYDKGAADILELLNAQSTLAEANQERIRTQAEWWSARLRLLASAGLLGREVVKNPVLSRQN